MGQISKETGGFCFVIQGPVTELEETSLIGSIGEEYGANLKFKDSDKRNTLVELSLSPDASAPAKIIEQLQNQRYTILNLGQK
jgi:hypothetical protein